MTNRPTPRHGGDLALASTVYGEPADGWLDLSTGINPTPYPMPPLPMSALTRLPEPGALDQLLTLARRAYSVPSHLAVAAVPGSEAAIRLMPHLAAPGRVAVITPTYRSHVEAWRAAGRDVAAIASADAALAGTSVLVLANPNNPDGRRTPPEHLLALTCRLAPENHLLVVDEAFADVEPGLSVIPQIGKHAIVVLRSFGKFFGLAGLRLGFLVGQPDIVARFRACFGDWPVSGPALHAGCAALADEAWAEASRERIGQSSRRLQQSLEQHGLRVIGNAGLFVLVENAEAGGLHQALARHGIWTRAFAERPNWLRLGVPDEAGFKRLETALARLDR